MKKLLYLLPVLFLAACNGQFNAAYGGGLWFIPLALFAGAGYSAYKYYVTEGKGPLIFGIILTIASIGSAIWMWGSRAAI